MNKKKIISTLTAAGMLATAGVTGVFAADETKTPSLGEFKTTIEGKTVTVVPFKVVSDTDKVTLSDLQAAYPGLSINAYGKTELATGDPVRINGLERTIVIYGDVNKDGTMDIYDITKIVNSVATETPLTGIELVAGDLNGDGVADIYDITRAVGAIAGDSYADMKVVVPTDVKTDVAIEGMEILTNKKVVVTLNKAAADYEYQIIVDEDGDELSIASAVTSDVKATITLTTPTSGIDNNILSAPTKTKANTYTLNILDKKDGSVVATKSFVYRELKPLIKNETLTFDITDSNVTNYTMVLKATDSNQSAADVKVTLYGKDDDDKKLVAKATATGTLPANTTTASVEFGDVSNLKSDVDYLVLVELRDSNGNTVTNVKKSESGKYVTDIDTVVDNIEEFTSIENAQADATYTFEYIGNDSVAPEVFVGDITRTAAKTATVNVSADKAVTAYYVIAKDANKAAPTESQMINDGKKVSAVAAATEITDVDLESTGAQKIYVMAVIRDDEVKSKIAEGHIASVNATELDPIEVTSITLDDDEYSWQDPNDEGVGGFLVRVLKANGTPVYEQKLDAETTSISIAKKLKEKDAKKGEEYKISVKVLGTVVDGEEYADTAETLATTNYVVKGIAEPTNIRINKDTAELTWDRGNNGEIADISGYTVNIYKAFEKKNSTAADKYEYLKVDSLPVDKDATSAKLKPIIDSLGNGLYTATVTAISGSDLKVNSKEAVNNGVDFTTLNFAGVTNTLYVKVVAPTIESYEAKEDTIKLIFNKLEIPGVDNIQYTVKVVGNNYSTESDATSPIINAVVTESTDEIGKMELKITNAGENSVLAPEKEYKVTLNVIANGVKVEGTTTEKITTTGTPIVTSNTDRYVVIDLSDKKHTESTVAVNNASSDPEKNYIGLTKDGYIVTYERKLSHNIEMYDSGLDFETLKALLGQLVKGDTFTLDTDDMKLGSLTLVNNGKIRNVDLDKYTNTDTQVSISGSTLKTETTLTAKAKDISILDANVVADLSNVTVDGNVYVLAGSDVTVKNDTKLYLPKAEFILNGTDMELKTNADTRAKVDSNGAIKLGVNNAIVVKDSNAKFATADNVKITAITVETTDDKDIKPVIDLVATDLEDGVQITIAGNDEDCTIITADKLTLASGVTVKATDLTNGMSVTYKTDNKVVIEGKAEIIAAASELKLAKATDVAIPDIIIANGVEFASNGATGTYDVDATGKLTIKMTGGKMTTKAVTRTVSCVDGVVTATIPTTGIDTDKITVDAVKLTNGEVKNTKSIDKTKITVNKETGVITVVNVPASDDAGNTLNYVAINWAPGFTEYVLMTSST